MIKRTLTEQRRAIGAYWEYVLGSCEELLVDLGNLAGKQGCELPGRRAFLASGTHTMVSYGLAADMLPKGQMPTPGETDDPDPGECERFRRKWSSMFLLLNETANDELLGLRRVLRRALIHGGPQDVQVLAIQIAHHPAPARPPGQTFRHFQYLDFYLPDRSSPKDLLVVPRPLAFAPDSMLPAELDWKPALPEGPIWKAPILFDFPRALAAGLLSFIGKGRKLVCCPQCGRCAIGRSNQRFCPGGKCRLAWHRSRPAYKEKWRKYMKGKMRGYRALEKRRNQTNLKLSRGKHAKAT